jgi:hypothetical protein
MSFKSGNFGKRAYKDTISYTKTKYQGVLAAIADEAAATSLNEGLPTIPQKVAHLTAYIEGLLYSQPTVSETGELLQKLVDKYLKTNEETFDKTTEACAKIVAKRALISYS